MSYKNGDIVVVRFPRKIGRLPDDIIREAESRIKKSLAIREHE